jgi:hypothetical protein
MGLVRKMSIASLLKSYVAAVWNYIVTHKHAFMISLGVSIVITIITNVFIHYLLDILKFIHAPQSIIHMVSGS